MVTIKEVASRAGVSPTTVSNVLHGRADEMSEQVRTRVNQALRDSGYVPSMAGKALAGRRSQMVGLIFSRAYREAGGALSDGYHGTLIDAIELALRARGYFMLLYGAATTDAGVAAAQAWSVDGLIILESKPRETARYLSAVKVPVVFIDGAEPEVPDLTAFFYNVRATDSEGAREMGQTLIAAGHKRLAFLADEATPFGVDLARWQGLRDVSPGATYLALDFHREKRQAQLTALIRRGELGRFDALFFSSDAFALDAMALLRAHGVGIPQDISVAGFDDGPLAALAQLSTVRQDISGKGREAVSLLFKRLDNKKSEKIVSIPTKIILRESIRDKNIK